MNLLHRPIPAAAGVRRSNAVAAGTSLAAPDELVPTPFNQHDSLRLPLDNYEDLRLS